MDSQSTLYQSHLIKEQKIKYALEFQHNIRNYKSIPKQYLPPSFPTTPAGSPTLKEDFLQAYNRLFFEYLDQIITYNTISLELEISQMKAIISHTESHLSATTLPAERSRDLLQQFLTQNSASHHHREQNPHPGSSPPATTNKIQTNNRQTRKRSRKQNRKSQKRQKRSGTPTQPKNESPASNTHFLSKRQTCNRHWI